MPKLVATAGQILVNEALPPEYRDYTRVLSSKELDKLLRQIAQERPEVYKDVTFKLNQIGKEVAYLSGGNSFGLQHLRTAPEVREMRQKIEAEVNAIIDDDNLTSAERNSKIVETLKARSPELRKKVVELAIASGNPLARQIASGARGNEASLNSLLGADLLYEDDRGRPIPVPILHNYSEGLMPSEYFAASYGARKGVIDKKLATQRAGYVGKQFNQLAHRLLVTALDDEDEISQQKALQRRRGMPVSVDDPENEGSLLAAPVGGYQRNDLITSKVLADLQRQGIENILVRSPIVGGPPQGGIYARDAGLREGGGLPGLYEIAGMTAVQGLNEKLTQSALSSKHSGGVAGEAKGVSGFDRIQNLANSPKVIRGGASHSQRDGQVTQIRPAPAGGTIVVIDGEEHYVHPSQKVSVLVGQEVEAGDMLSEGIPSIRDIVHHKGVGEGKRYFVQALRDSFRSAGLTASRRNIELLARGLIDHVRTTDEFGAYLPNDIVSYQELENEYQPREDADEREPEYAKGRYLEEPVLHYSIGTKLRPSVIKNLQQFGVSKVRTHEAPPPFEPEFIRAADNLQHDKDWMTRMYGSSLRKSLQDAAWSGAESRKDSTSFVPALAEGVNFGREGYFQTPTAPFKVSEPTPSNRSITKLPGISPTPPPMSKAADASSWDDKWEALLQRRGESEDKALAGILAPRTRDLLPGGLADKAQPQDFPAKALLQGVETEMEHTDNPLIAREVTMDHLTEREDYYRMLKALEKKADDETPDDYEDLVKAVRGLPLEAEYGNVYFNPETHEAWIELSDSDERENYEAWKKALSSLSWIKKIRAESEYSPWGVEALDKEMWIKLISGGRSIHEAAGERTYGEQDEDGLSPYLESDDRPRVFVNVLQGKIRISIDDDQQGDFDPDKLKWLYRSLVRSDDDIEIVDEGGAATEDGWKEVRPFSKEEFEKAAADLTDVYLIRGNPDREPEKREEYDRFYQDAMEAIRSAGLSASMVGSDPHTAPPGGQFWIAHSRGRDRLRFAPEGVKTLVLDDYETEDGPAPFPDPSDPHGPQAPEHRVFNDRMRQAVESLLNSKTLPSRIKSAEEVLGERWLEGSAPGQGFSVKLDRPKGFLKKFNTPAGPVETAYPVDYGFIDSVINPDDNEPADVFVGSGGPHAGRFMKGTNLSGKWEPDEHKWYYGLTDEELAAVKEMYYDADGKDSQLLRDFRQFKDLEELWTDMLGHSSTSELKSASLEIDRPRGTRKVFSMPSGKKEVTYPVDYGFLSGVLNPEDGEEADVFVGSGGPLHGRFMKGKTTNGRWEPDETKWYVSLTVPELVQVRRMYESRKGHLLRDFQIFRSREEALEDLRTQAPRLMKTAVQKVHLNGQFKLAEMSESDKAWLQQMRGGKPSVPPIAKSTSNPPATARTSSLPSAAKTPVQKPTMTSTSTRLSPPSPRHEPALSPEALDAKLNTPATAKPTTRPLAQPTIPVDPSLNPSRRGPNVPYLDVAWDQPQLPDGTPVGLPQLLQAPNPLTPQQISEIYRNNPSALPQGVDPRQQAEQNVAENLRSDLLGTGLQAMAHRMTASPSMGQGVGVAQIPHTALSPFQTAYYGLTGGEGLAPRLGFNNPGIMTMGEGIATGLADNYLVQNAVPAATQRLANFLPKSKLSEALARSGQAYANAAQFGRAATKAAPRVAPGILTRAASAVGGAVNVDEVRGMLQARDEARTASRDLRSQRFQAHDRFNDAITRRLQTLDQERAAGTLTPEDEQIQVNQIQAMINADNNPADPTSLASYENALKRLQSYTPAQRVWATYRDPEATEAGMGLTQESWHDKATRWAAELGKYNPAHWFSQQAALDAARPGASPNHPGRVVGGWFPTLGETVSPLIPPKEPVPTLPPQGFRNRAVADNYVSPF